MNKKHVVGLSLGITGLIITITNFLMNTDYWGIITPNIIFWTLFGISSLLTAEGIFLGSANKKDNDKDLIGTKITCFVFSPVLIVMELLMTYMFSQKPEMLMFIGGTLLVILLAIITFKANKWLLNKLDTEE